MTQQPSNPGDGTLLPCPFCGTQGTVTAQLSDADVPDLWMEKK